MLRGAGLTSLSNQYTASEGERNSRAFEKYVRYVGRNLRTFANLSLDHFLGGLVIAMLFSQHVYDCVLELILRPGMTVITTSE